MAAQQEQEPRQHQPPVAPAASSSSSKMLDFSRLVGSRSCCGDDDGNNGSDDDGQEMMMTTTVNTRTRTRTKELDKLLAICRVRRRKRPRRKFLSSSGSSNEHSLPDVADVMPCCYQPKSLTRAVIIQAESGLGKSELLNGLCDELTGGQQNFGGDVFCCRGKFEARAAASEPFTALREAMDVVLDYFLEEDRLREKLIRQTTTLHLQPKGRQQRQQQSASESHAVRTRKVLGPDIGILTSVLPKMKQLQEQDNHSYECSAKEQPPHYLSISLERTDKMEWRFERLRFAFRALIRYAAQFKSIVFVIDDLQWSDPDSLKIISTLIKDEVLRGDPVSYSNSKRSSSFEFTFVGASRTLNEYQSLKKHVAETISADVLEVMELPYLTVDEIAHICVSLLKYPDDNGSNVAELASHVHGKAGGNAFVILQYLRLLEQETVIYFDDYNQRWTWDFSRMQQEASNFHEETVQHLIAAKIQNLDERIRLALIVAAAFGVSQFDLATIVHAAPIVEEKGNTEGHPHKFSTETSSDYYVAQRSIAELKGHIAKAVQDDLLVEDSTAGLYHWSHDRIREAAYLLFPHGDEGKEMHLDIGRQLRSWMDTQEELGYIANFSENQLLLHAVKQLYMGRDLITDSWEKLDLADLCFAVADLATQQSAFSTSIEYLQQGLTSLPSHAWQEYPDRRLKFCVALVRLHYTLGHLEDCMDAANDILEHVSDFQETKAVYHTIMLCRLQQHRAIDGIDLARSVLNKKLNMKLPRNLLLPRAIANYFRIANQFRSLSDEEILAIPVTCDKIQTQDMYELFLRIVDVAFHDGSIDYVSIGVYTGLFMMDYLFQFGAHPAAFVPFMYFEQISFVMGDVESANRCHHLGVVFLEKGKNDPAVSNMAHRGAASVLFNTMGATPVNFPTRQLKEGLEMTWRNGCLDWLFLDCLLYLRFLFLSGRVLSSVVGECNRFSEMLSDYKQSLQWLNNAPLHQSVLILLGDEMNDNDPTTLVGSHLSASQIVNKSNNLNEQQAVNQYHFFAMWTAYHFGDYTKAKQMLKKFPTNIWASGCDFSVLIRFLYTGLVYTALCNETDNRLKTLKYKKRASAALKQLSFWCNKGSVNSFYMRDLLQAEVAGVGKGGVHAVLSLYEKAIHEVKKLEILQHIALANELAASFALKHTKEGEPTLALAYTREALKYYREWGAKRKVQHLQSTHAALLAMADESMTENVTLDHSSHSMSVVVPIHHNQLRNRLF